MLPTSRTFVHLGANRRRWDAFANPPYGDQPADPNTTTRPLFRAFSPVADKSRTFPSLTYILNNANIPPATVGGLQTAENLPGRLAHDELSRHRPRPALRSERQLSRDHRGWKRGTICGHLSKRRRDGKRRPELLPGVANTNNVPVSTANVKISLSTDGGNTFPTVLAASMTNNGTALVTFPNGIITSTARIKVEAVGNIYFDISDANFTIMPGDSCPAVSDFTPKVGNVGNTVTITGINFKSGMSPP